MGSTRLSYETHPSAVMLFNASTSQCKRGNYRDNDSVELAIKQSAESTDLAIVTNSVSNLRYLK